jgi:DNA-binding NarL/FixJ family response regulator
MSVRTYDKHLMALRVKRAAAIKPRKTIDGIAILQAMADGNNLKTIAFDLGRNYNSVKNKLHHVYDKMGAENITHAVAIALRKGLIS